MKKSRSFNFLIELLIVIVFFTISVIICVNIFYQAKIKSELAKNISDATLSVQNLVEYLKVNNLDNNNYKYDEYEINIIKKEELFNKYIVYEIKAVDNNGRELLKVETTVDKGELK